MATGDKPKLIVTTTLTVEGFEVAEYLGIVRGIVVRATSISQGIRGAFRSFVGGNVAAFEEVCEQARSDAFKRMARKRRDRSRRDHRHGLRCDRVLAGND